MATAYHGSGWAAGSDAVKPVIDLFAIKTHPLTCHNVHAKCITNLYGWMAVVIVSLDDSLFLQLTRTIV